MGLLSWLFGRSRETNSSLTSGKQQIPFLNGPGDFSLDVVGESHYQAALKNLCGKPTYDGYEKVVEATLIPEDDNEYDSKAIRIDIDGQTVGYLSRETARLYRKRMKEKGLSGTTVRCPAVIMGGWKRGDGDIGSYGVKLDLPLEYLEIRNVQPSKLAEQEPASVHADFVFDISKLKQNELSECRIGDYVKLWMPSETPQEISIFRRGTIGGLGKLGCVPDKYFNSIAAHLKKGLPVDAKILELAINKCRIACRLISQKQIDKMKNAVRRQFEAEVKKKYTPKKGFLFFLWLPRDHKLNEGQIIHLDKEPIEDDPMRGIRIRFVDENGSIVAYKHNEQEKILRILRAKNSGYELIIKMQSIDSPDPGKFAYLSHIDATARVDFQRRGEG